jgi:predicted helicase
LIINEYIDTNLDLEFVNQIAKKLGLTFVPEKEPAGKVCYINNPEVRNDFKTTFAPIDILDYIYAVLHSPAYREKYKEFLKIDFPRVPYPADSETFWQLVELGSQLRQIHLLESPKVNEFITSYPVDGDNTVTRKMTTKSIGWEPTNKENTTGRVWINDTQYFDGIPLIAWEFYIGGYQPAQKWLKDRHGRTLSFEDILHYQKIIVALTETHQLMQAVDEVGVENC